MFTGEDIKALKAAVAKPVLWQHARDGVAYDVVRVLRHHALVRRLLERTGVHGMASVDELSHVSGSAEDWQSGTHLFCLVTSYNHIPSIGDDNIVATVDARVVYGLVLAHEHERNALCELSEHALGRVYVVPHPRVGQRRLGAVSDSLRMREVLTFPIACDILCQPVQCSLPRSLR